MPIGKNYFELTTTEVASVLGISTQRVFQLIEAGKLQVRRVQRGKRNGYMISPETVHSYIVRKTQEISTSNGENSRRLAEGIGKLTSILEKQSA